MIAITRKCRYALRALFYLARERRQEPVSIAEIAKATQAPLDFLETIFVQLRDARIVESRRGCYGGYVFAMPPEKVSIGMVVRAMDGPLLDLPCMDPSEHRRCPDCPGNDDCEMPHFLREIHDSAAAILDHTPLSSFGGRAEPAQL